MSAQSRISTCSPSDEYYDTPKKLKNCLLWEYGNYDTPPPAVPVTPSTFISETSRPNEVSMLPCIPGSQDHFNCSKVCRHPDRENILQVNKIKLTGEGKMPVVNSCGEIISDSGSIYEEELEHQLEHKCISTEETPCPNYMNVDIEVEKQEENISKTETLHQSNNNYELDTSSYSNIDFALSLENYENIRHFYNEEPAKVNKNDKHQSQTYKNEHSCSKYDYRSNEETQNKNANSGQLVACHNNVSNSMFQQNVMAKCCCHKSLESNTLRPPKKHNSSIPQIEKTQIQKEELEQGMFPNVTDRTHREKENNYNKVQSDSAQRRQTIGAHYPCSVSVVNSPHLERPVGKFAFDGHTLNSKMQKLCLKKRSNSADSLMLHTDDGSISDRSFTPESREEIPSAIISVNSQCAKNMHPQDVEFHNSTMTNNNKHENKLAPLELPESSDMSSNSNEISALLPVQITELNNKSESINARRSSSVPSKFCHNRDSSSSNDSGVFTSSYKHHGTDFVEFEMPLTTSLSSMRHHIVLHNKKNNETDGFISLPRRSKSVDPLRELTFQFEQEEQHMKSTSAEAEVPVMSLGHPSKGYWNGSRNVPFPDSHSTSSGTSDMSDYIETLSFSSFSSLDCPDSFRYGRPSATTMKPRSGKEYQKIDRHLLECDSKVAEATTTVEKSEPIESKC